MANLKLARLPDRTPVKMTITISPELNKSLSQYADDYNKAYGNAEPEQPNALVPYILQSFLDSDRAFVRAQKERRGENGCSLENTPVKTPRRTRGAETST